MIAQRETSFGTKDPAGGLLFCSGGSCEVLFGEYNCDRGVERDDRRFCRDDRWFLCCCLGDGVKHDELNRRSYSFLTRSCCEYMVGVMVVAEFIGDLGDVGFVDECLG